MKKGSSTAVVLGIGAAAAAVGGALMLRKKGKASDAETRPAVTQVSYPVPPMPAEVPPVPLSPSSGDHQQMVTDAIASGDPARMRAVAQRLRAEGNEQAAQSVEAFLAAQQVSAPAVQAAIEQTRTIMQPEPGELMQAQPVSGPVSYPEDQIRTPRPLPTPAPMPTGPRAPVATVPTDEQVMAAVEAGDRVAMARYAAQYRAAGRPNDALILESGIASQTASELAASKAITTEQAIRLANIPANLAAAAMGQPAASPVQVSYPSPEGPVITGGPMWPVQDPTKLDLATRMAINLAGSTKGREDQGLVRKFQTSEGLTVDGHYGAISAIALGERYGIVPPKPLWWPTDKSKIPAAKAKFSAAMVALADRDPARASEWMAASRV